MKNTQILNNTNSNLQSYAQSTHESLTTILEYNTQLITTKTINKYFKLVNNFDNIKKFLKENKITLLHYLFSNFYKFSNAIEHANFYHYTVEAWILTIFKQLELKYINDLSIGISSFLNYSFNDILEEIYSFFLNEELFIENLEILLGTYKMSDPILKITQIKLSELFLKKVEIAKSNLLHSKIPQSLSKRNFEDILFLLLKNALNLTLNELDAGENEKGSLMLLNIYTELKAKLTEGSDEWKYKHPILNDFIKEVNLIKNKKDSERRHKAAEVELLNPNETFYYFAICSYGLLLKDIEIFILNSSSMIERINYTIKNSFLGKISKIKNLAFYTINLIQNLKNNIRNEHLAPYLHLVNQTYFQEKYKVMTRTNNAMRNFRFWVDKAYFTYFHESKLNLSLIGVVKYTYKGMTVIFNKVINIFISTLKWSRELTILIFEQIQLIIKDIFGEKPLIRINNNFGEKYFKIAINKRIINYEKVVELINKLIQLFNSNLEFNKVVRLLSIENFKKIL
jgi:hypothetical protein